jgi:ABC-type transport system involved in multi-copper enzyme maturation permease subunit
MSGKTIAERQEERPQPAGWAGGREVAPSLLREDQPGAARAAGLVGAVLVIVGGIALAFNLSGRFQARLGSGWAMLMVAVGLGGLLIHAAFDREREFRRVYLVFALALLGIGAFLCVAHFYSARTGALFLYGVPCLLLCPLFLLAFLRTEDEPAARDIAQYALGGAGAVMVVIGLFGGNLRGDFLLPYGLILALLGLFYVAAFVGARGISNDLGYGAAVGLTAVGLLVVVVALIRSFLPNPPRYFGSFGFLLLVIGLLYVAIGAGLASDRPLAVLTRREVGAFFYSPMAYLVLFGFSIVSYVNYFLFLLALDNPDFPNFEPIVGMYIFNLFPVFTVVFMVPVLTMRLLSEEQRSGTLEVLLTAPVNETGVVMSKFLAALLTYLVIWLPFGLFLAAIPLGGGEPFDYRPLLSFFIVIAVTGAGFIAMGLFFSSLTRNQVASGVLAFAGMLILTGFYWGQGVNDRGSTWFIIFRHLSYLNAWRESLRGELVPRDLLFPLSLAILFLFLTVKVLESRKWR